MPIILASHPEAFDNESARDHSKTPPTKLFYNEKGFATDLKAFGPLGAPNMTLSDAQQAPQTKGRQVLPESRPNVCWAEKAFACFSFV